MYLYITSGTDCNAAVHISIDDHITKKLYFTDNGIHISNNLMDILDMSQPISMDLRRIYNYLVYDLSIVKAGRERRQDEIGRIRHILSELREAFDEASRKVNDMDMLKESNIRG